MKLPPPIKKIKWVTPTNLTVLKKCPYRIALSNTLDEPLLPYHPNIYLGSVVHKCIELIFSGNITSTKEFEKKWDDLIAEQELKLKDLGFNSLLPLKENVNSLPIKKLQVKRLLNNGQSESEKRDSKCYLEKWLKAKDSLIIGKVDLLYQADDYIKIIDFKSGNVLDSEGCIKKNYVEQLKLYAYLCNEEYGQYPNQISLVDLKNEEYPISFTASECKKIASEARTLLSEINNKIEFKSRGELAQPSKEVCNGCLYKPACKFHWENEKNANQKFTDIRGKLVSIRKFKNGNINLTLQNTGEKLVVEGFREEHQNFLKQKESQIIAIYNVVKLNKENRFGTMTNTKVYTKFA